MDFNFDPASLIASIIVSGIGTVAFFWGKSQSRVAHMGAGIVLSIFPYFVTNVYLMLAIAGAVLGLLYGAVRVLRV